MPERDSQREAPSGRVNGVPSGAPRAATAEAPRPASDRLVTGVLLKHGPARFGFQADGHPTYFITLQTDRGERTLWGKGLERALTQSKTQPQLGEQVGVRENGIDPVTVTFRTRDAAGNVVQEKRFEEPRAHWVVERRDFFDEREAAARAFRDPRASRKEAVRNHPDLLGSYWALDSAKKVADARIQNLQSRERFVELVREALAHAIERGEPLPVAQRSDPSVTRAVATDRTR